MKHLICTALSHMMVLLLYDAKEQVVYGNISRYMPKMKAKFRRPPVEVAKPAQKKLRSRGPLLISFQRFLPRYTSLSYLCMATLLLLVKVSEASQLLRETASFTWSSVWTVICYVRRRNKTTYALRTFSWATLKIAWLWLLTMSTNKRTLSMVT